FSTLINNKCTSFFFSSRRRHTRCLSDWSSDVCSSDLPRQVWTAARVVRPCDPDSCSSFISARPVSSWNLHRRDRVQRPRGDEGRSEERRVGKECRCRWCPYY